MLHNVPESSGLAHAVVPFGGEVASAAAQPASAKVQSDFNTLADRPNLVRCARSASVPNFVIAGGNACAVDLEKNGGV